MPPRAGGPPRQLVILLHGGGTNGDDLIGLAPAPGSALPGAAFVAPNAPEPS
jgi:phospholipase/carboxylesterase